MTVDQEPVHFDGLRYATVRSAGTVTKKTSPPCLLRIRSGARDRRQASLVGSEVDSAHQAVAEDRVCVSLDDKSPLSESGAVGYAHTLRTSDFQMSAGPLKPQRKAAPHGGRGPAFRWS